MIKKQELTTSFPKLNPHPFSIMPLIKSKEKKINEILHNNIHNRFYDPNKTPLKSLAIKFKENIKISKTLSSSKRIFSPGNTNIKIKTSHKKLNNFLDLNRDKIKTLFIDDSNRDFTYPESILHQYELLHEKINSFSDKFINTQESIFCTTSPKKTPIKKKKVNKLLRLNSESKKIVKKQKKIKLESKLNEQYQNYLMKQNQINVLKLADSNSAFAHKIKTEILMLKNQINLQKERESNHKYNKKQKEIITGIELKDHVDFNAFDMENILKEIRKYLSDGVKLNQIEIHEKIYDNFANRINFIFDGLKLPDFRNNLFKVPIDDLDLQKKCLDWNYPNRIASNTLTFLGKLKAKLQREADEKQKRMNKKKEIEKKYKFYKKLGTKLYNDKEHIENIIFGNLDFTQKEDLEFEKKIDDKGEGLEFFFSDKKDKEGPVCIASGKAKNFVYINYESSKCSLDVNKRYFHYY